MTMMNRETLVIDLDGTLCSQEKTGTYHLAKPRKDVIKKVNELWQSGWKIIIFTARGMNTHDEDLELIEELYRKLTISWLSENRVCYDILKFGKPSADVYVDDKGVNISEFITIK